jgi:hypothetical protein
MCLQKSVTGNFLNLSSRSKAQLEKALKWETAFIDFMKNWTANEENTRYMDVAFNSERSIEVRRGLFP